MFVHKEDEQQTKEPFNLKKWCWQESKPGDPYWEIVLRAIVRIFFIVAREFSRNLITIRAGALTFTIIFSMVPALALGSAVLKGLGASGELKTIAYKMIDEFAPTYQKALSKKNIKGENKEQVTIKLKKIVDKIFEYVNQTNFTALGAIGVITLIGVIFSTIANIEDAMNAIWHAHKGRSIGRRLMNYFAILIILPLAANIGFAAIAAVESPAIWQKLQYFLPMAKVVKLGLRILPVLVVVIGFILLYKFLPNTKVAFLPACIGGTIGGIAWLIVMAIYIKLQIGVARYNAIYGSFATVPLVLLWIYTGWLIFLTGAELSFAIQTWHRHLPSQIIMKPSHIFSLCLDVMGYIYLDFEKGKTSKISVLSKRMGCPDAIIKKAVDELLAAKYLRRIYNRYQVEVVPKAPAKNIKVEEMLGAFLGEYCPETPGGNISKLAIESAKKGVSNLTLEHVVESFKEKNFHSLCEQINFGNKEKDSGSNKEA